MKSVRDELRESTKRKQIKEIMKKARSEVLDDLAYYDGPDDGEDDCEIDEELLQFLKEMGAKLLNAFG